MGEDQERDWARVVDLMRRDVSHLASGPEYSGRLMLRVAAAMHRYLEQLRGRMRVGASDLDAVIALWDGGSCTPTELGRRIVLTRAAITTLADRLVHAGLVERMVDPADRRRLVLAIAPEADRLLWEATRELREEVDRIAYGHEDWPALARELVGIRRCFGTAGRALENEQRTRERAPRALPAMPVTPPAPDSAPDRW